MEVSSRSIIIDLLLFFRFESIFRIAYDKSAKHCLLHRGARLGFHFVICLWVYNANILVGQVPLLKRQECGKSYRVATKLFLDPANEKQTLNKLINR